MHPKFRNGGSREKKIAGYGFDRTDDLRIATIVAPTTPLDVFATNPRLEPILCNLASNSTSEFDELTSPICF